jgi:hypothetical protein
MLVRVLRAAAAQMGPTQKADSREHTLGRMLALLEEAAARGAPLVVFPELAFTTFFPRWLIEGEALDHYFERGMPNPAVQPLFDRARALGIGFYVGYAELTSDGQRFNGSILVDRDGEILGRYRKVHLPGSVEPRAGATYQQLEKRYFEYGDLGFPAFRAGPDWRHAIMGMMICNDRRWPESYREMGLQGVEMILCGYNTPIHYVPDPSQDILQGFHNALVMQAGAYQNGTWVVGVAKGGVEEGVDSLVQSMIIAPSGQIVAQAVTSDDELVVARCDLDWCKRYKGTLFDFDRYRRPELYDRITSQRGVVEPA